MHLVVVFLVLVFSNHFLCALATYHEIQAAHAEIVSKLSTSYIDNVPMVFAFLRPLFIHSDLKYKEIWHLIPSYQHEVLHLFWTTEVGVSWINLATQSRKRISHSSASQFSQFLINCHRACCLLRPWLLEMYFIWCLIQIFIFFSFLLLLLCLWNSLLQN